MDTCTNDVAVKTIPIEGRCVIELSHMAGQMICQSCMSSLHLLDIIHLQQYGLASIFSVICSNCSLKNTVTTNMRQNGKKGPFVVNCKKALGKCDFIFPIFDTV